MWSAAVVIALSGATDNNSDEGIIAADKDEMMTPDLVIANEHLRLSCRVLRHS